MKRLLDRGALNSAHRRRRLLSSFFVGLMLGVLVLPQVSAAELPLRAPEVRLEYQDKPLREALREFFAAQGVAAVISEKISASISGKFVMRSESYLNSLASVFGILFYFDGNVAYVYDGNEAIGRTIGLGSISAERLRRALSDARAVDRKYPVHISEDGQFARVSGPPRYVEAVSEIASMLAEADRVRRIQSLEAAPFKPVVSAFRVFRLKYAWAQDTALAVSGREIVVPGVASTLRRLAGNYSVQARREPSGAVSSRVQSSANTAARLRGQGLQSIEGAGLRRSVSDDGAADSPMVSDAGAHPQATGSSLNISLPRIEADARTNSVIVHDVSERLEGYGELISSLDVKPFLIEIEAAILDVSSDSTARLGVNWGNSQLNVLVAGGGQAGGVVRAAQGAGASVINGVLQGGAGLTGATTIVGNLGRAFLAQVDLLAQDGRAYVHARPSVLAMSNTEAVLENSRTFYVRLAGERDVDLFNISAGTVLRVTAAVVEESPGTRSIKLAVRIEDGTITGQVVDQIPIVQRGTVGTHAMIPEGQSLLVGGYSYSLTRDLLSKVPGLGDLPWVGALFKFKEKDVSKVSRMFLITPRIVSF